MFIEVPFGIFTLSRDFPEAAFFAFFSLFECEMDESETPYLCIITHVKVIAKSIIKFSG